MQTRTSNQLLTLQKQWRAQAVLGELSALLARADLIEAAESALQRHFESLPWQQTLLQFAQQESAAQLMQADSPKAALEVLKTFRILTPHRRGSQGLIAMNEKLEQALLQQFPRTAQLYQRHLCFSGKAILVNQNQPELGLMNGDVGVLWPDAQGEFHAHFDQSNPAGVPLQRLHGFEAGLVSTVHKAQGSEYAHVLLLIPQSSSQLLSHQLLYTAITRAKASLRIVGDWSVLQRALRNRTSRQTGLNRRLASPTEERDLEPV
jgi:exodeoxyribonuclease V alpha subunit